MLSKKLSNVTVDQIQMIYRLKKNILQKILNPISNDPDLFLRDKLIQLFELVSLKKKARLFAKAQVPDIFFILYQGEIQYELEGLPIIRIVSSQIINGVGVFSERKSDYDCIVVSQRATLLTLPLRNVKRLQPKLQNYLTSLCIQVEQRRLQLIKDLQDRKRVFKEEMGYRLLRDRKVNLNHLFYKDIFFRLGKQKYQPFGHPQKSVEEALALLSFKTKPDSFSLLKIRKIRLTQYKGREYERGKGVISRPRLQRSRSMAGQ